MSSPPASTDMQTGISHQERGREREKEREREREDSPVSEAYGPSRGFTGTVKQHQLLAPV